jgi:hypothetical protein
LLGFNVCAGRISGGKGACRFFSSSHVICDGKTDIIAVAGRRGKSNYAVTDPERSSLLGIMWRNVVPYRGQRFICCCFGLTKVIPVRSLFLVS